MKRFPAAVTDPEKSAIIAKVMDAALAAASPFEAVTNNLSIDGGSLSLKGVRYPIAADAKVVVLAAGKGAVPMMNAAVQILGARLSRGVLVTKTGHLGDARFGANIALFEAAHPVPDLAAVKAAEHSERLIASLGPDDLLITLVSGGASALLTLPAGRLALEDIQAVTDLLLRAGADIAELNSVRKHLSRISGGRLARRAAPARTLSLILSDVIGDPLDVIASGPTAPDPTCFADATAVLHRYGLRAQLPQAVVAYLERGAGGCESETPKPGDPLFDKVANVIVGNNAIAAEAAAAAARTLGLNSLVLSTTQCGEAREVGGELARTLAHCAAGGGPVPRPACLIVGGETTVTVTGGGKGGRNQELALAAAAGLEGLSQVAVIALGTDGTDGPTDAAGAIATGTTAARARQAGLDIDAILKNNDSYRFFEKLGDLLLTGPTGTNVSDLVFLFAF